MNNKSLLRQSLMARENQNDQDQSNKSLLRRSLEKQAGVAPGSFAPTNTVVPTTPQRIYKPGAKTYAPINLRSLAESTIAPADIAVSKSSKHQGGGGSFADTKATADYVSPFAKNDDYKELSQYKSTKKAEDTKKPLLSFLLPGQSKSSEYEDKWYEYVNRNPDVVDLTDADLAKMGASFSAANRSYLKQMSDEQIADYNYVYATQGKDEAEKFLDSLQKDLSAKQNEKFVERTQEYAREHPVAASAASVIAGPAKGLSLIGQLAEYADTGDIDPNSLPNRFVKQNQIIRQTVPENWSKVGQFLYGTGMSIADNLYNMALTGAFGNIGGLGEGAQSLILGIMGSSAAADSTLTALENGYSADRALIQGAIAGGIEALTEKISLETLLSPNAFKDGTIKYLLKNMAAEGSEEGASTISNWVVDWIGDLITDENRSDFRQVFTAFDRGDTKEGWRKIGEMGLDLAQDVAGGMLSGGVLAGGGSVANTIGNINLGSALNQTSALSDMSEFVNDSYADSLKNPDATRYQKQLSQRALEQFYNDGKVSNRTLGELAQNNMYMAEEQANTVNLLNEASQRINQGKQITSSQMREILDNKQAVRTLRDNYGLRLNDNMSYSDRFNAVQDALTNRLNSNDAQVKLGFRADMVAKFAKTLGSQGERTLNAMARANGYEDVEAFSKGYTQIYNAVKADPEVKLNDLSVKADYSFTPQQLNTIYKSAVKDYEADLKKTGLSYEGETNAEETATGSQDSGTDGVGTVSLDSEVATGSVAGRTAEAESRKKATDVRIESIRNNAALNRIAEVTSTEAGIPGGVNTDQAKTVRVLSESQWSALDTDTYNFLHELKDMGYEVKAWTGTALAYDEMSGKNAAVRGFIQGNTIGVRVDANLSARKIAYHEMFHDMVKIDSSLQADMVKKINEHYGEGKLETIVRDYVNQYGWTNASSEEILNEILADAYAGIDIYEDLEMNYEGATQVSSDVRGFLSENGVKTRNGMNAGQFSRDSDGNNISTEQAEYFKDSRVRNEDGSLQVVYHGTANGGAFTVFDAAKLSNSTLSSHIGQGFYFTDSESGAREYLNNTDIYGNTSKGKNQHLFKGYLNITNPLEITESSKNIPVETIANILADGDYDWFFSSGLPHQLANKEVEGAKYTKSELQAMPKEEKTMLYAKYLTQMGDMEALQNLVRAYRSESQGKLLSAMKKHTGNDGIVWQMPNGTHQYVAFDSNQFKNADNVSPTPNPDVRFSREELNDITRKVDNGEGLQPAEEVAYSLDHDEDFIDRERKREQNFVSSSVLEQSFKQREQIRNILRSPGIRELLPEDNMGKTSFGNGSYGRSMEHSTICPRSLSMEAILDGLSERFGRPITVKESVQISQLAWAYMDAPECAYCYVAMDRKARREALLNYLKSRNEFLKDIDSGMSREDAEEKFLNGREPTKPMKDRMNAWIKLHQNGSEMIQMKDLASDRAIKAAAKSASMADQVKDALKYAQSASWAKKYVQYTAYNGEILKWSKKLVDMLNRMYGMRMYSFSDFHPAFTLEDMQMITDAALRGLKVLAYTKEIDFARIMEPTGANINISVFAQNTKDENGDYGMDAMQGADWEEAKALRAKSIENGTGIGITMVCTSDDQIEWALAQDWIDVVIPFHMVKTGNIVRQEFGWKNYTEMQNDKKLKDLWDGKNDQTMIEPPEHQNNKQLYQEALERNHLSPRFEKWWGNPNYMKLVNETRRAEGETPTVQPVFNLDAADEMFDQMKKQGGYYQHLGLDTDVFEDLQDTIYDDYVEKYGEPMHFSRDTDYMEAVNSGDMDTAQRMVDEAAKEAGYSVKSYHGTLSGGFTVFDRSYAHVGGNSGAGFYTSTTREDAEGNYSDVEGADNYFKARNLAEKIEEAIADGFWEGPELSGEDEILEYAKQQITKKPQTYTLYGNPGKTYIRDYRNSTNIYDDIMEDFDESLVDREDYDSDGDYEDDLFNYQSEHLYESIENAVYEAMDSMEDQYEYVDFTFTVADLTQKIANEAVDYQSLTWKDISDAIMDIGEVSVAFEDENEPAFGEPELTRAIIEALGYDSITDREVSKKFNQIQRMGAIGADTEHVIYFRPEQMKLADTVTRDDQGNVIPLSERFNRENNDIRFSRDLKSEEKRASGAKLTENQFYSLYSAHKLDMRGQGNVEDQIQAIRENGFKGTGGFSGNTMPTNLSYKTENGKRIPANASVGRYAPRKGDRILLVPRKGLDSQYNVKLGYKPDFDYEIVTADYDYQPYYEMYSKAYDATNGNTVRFSRDTTGMESELQKQNRELNKELKEVTERYHYFKDQLVLTKVRQATEKSANRVAKQLVKDYSSNVSADEIAKALREASKLVLNVKDDTDIDELQTQLKDALRPYAMQMVTNASELINAEDVETQKSIRNDLRNGAGIIVTEQMKKDVPDWASFRKAQFGNMKLVSGAKTNIHDVYLELSQKYGEGYFPADVSNESDMLQVIADVMADLSAIYDNPYTYGGANIAEAIESCTNDMMMSVVGSLEAEQPTFADKKKAEKKEALRKQAIKLRAEALERVKEQRDRTWEKASAKYKKRIKSIYDKRQQYELRTKIRRKVKGLSDKLLKPTDEKHIPYELQGAVIEVLRQINTGSRFDLTADGSRVELGTGIATKKTNAFIELEKRLTELSNELILDENLLDSKENGTIGYLTELAGLPEISIDSMDTEQLQSVLAVVNACEAAIRTWNKTVSDAKWAEISEAGEALYTENADKNPRDEYREGIERTINLLTVDNLTPEAYFSRMGNAGKALFKMLRAAQDDNIRILKEAQEFSEENGLYDLKLKDYEQKTVTVRFGNRDVEMSKAQLMELYILNKREASRVHIEVGGILPEAVQKKFGIKKVTYAEPIRNITQEDIAKAMTQLSPEDIKIADAMQEFISTVMTKHGNDASMKVYGYKKFGDENYWPIRVNSQDLRTELGEVKTRARSVSNKGFTKPIKPNANQSVAIGSIFDTFTEHVAEMANYASHLAVEKDINRIYNFTERDAKGAIEVSTKYVMRNVYGPQGTKYFEKLMQDLANGMVSEQSYFGGLVGKFKAAAVGSNLRVILQQPTAIFRAMDMISPRYLAQGLLHAKSGMRKAIKNSPIAQWKDWGYFDINTGRSTKNILFQNSSGLDRVQNALMSGAGLADSVSWGALYSAVEAEIKDTRPDLDARSKEFDKVVADRFADIIDHSQVVDGVLQRSALMRSQNWIDKFATAFMAEPTKQYNMMLTAIYDLQHSGPENKAQATRVLARTTAAMLFAGVLNAAVQSIVDAIRDDDPEEKYWEKFLMKFTGEEDTVVEFMKSNLGDFLNPAQYVPYAKDIVSLFQGFDVERTDLSLFKDLIDDGKKVLNSFDGKGKYSQTNNIINFMNTASKFLGMSIGNVKRDVAGIANTIAQETGSYVFEYRMAKFTYNLNQATNKGRFVEVLAKAYEAGDREAFNIIMNDLIKEDKFATTTMTTEEWIKKRLKDKHDIILK